MADTGIRPSGPETSEAERVFRACARRAARGGSRVVPMASILNQAADRMREPMRLALVGQIKRGKSTLVNALLGQPIAATGQLELTFTVSEFSYGTETNVHVHYKDGTVEGPLAPQTLHGLTTRDPGALDKLQKIRSVEYAMPNDLLRTFRIVDTPGMGSVYGGDGQNSLDYLGIVEDEFAAVFADGEERATATATLAAMGRTARDLQTDSLRAAATADAVLYLFTRGLHSADLGTMVRFLGSAAGNMTPLHAFGVLSRADEYYWPPDRRSAEVPDPLTFDPMTRASEIAERYLAEPDIGSTFYTILPVVGLLGIGATLLTAEELTWLEKLSRAEPSALYRAVHDINRFAHADELRGVTLPVGHRARLVARLGGWGTYLAAGYLRQKVGEDELRTRLFDHSGVTRLRELVTSHFGNRSATIKLDHGIRDVTAEIGRRRMAIRLAKDTNPPALDDIAARIERLRLDDHGGAELAALGAHYNGELDLGEDEVRELLTVTGEHGTTLAARLGLPENSAVFELVTEAKRHADNWSALAVDRRLDRPTRTAARTIRTSYERLLQQARDPDWTTIDDADLEATQP